jgi:hypothetical protein
VPRMHSDALAFRAAEVLLIVSFGVRVVKLARS